MDRLADVTPFIVMDIVKKANQMDDAIHFEVGQPDIKPSEKVIKAMGEAVYKGNFPYTESMGILPLRQKISDHYKRKYGIDVSPERILLTTGTSGAFLIAYSIALNAGEKLAFSDPGYPCYKNFAHILDIITETVDVNADTDYQITPDLLEQKHDIKAVQISSPANPTGNIYSKSNILNMINYCKTNNITLISDEIYHGLVYSDTKENSALEFSDDVIVINGFSKYFCLPGARLGWMILPEKYIRRAEIVMQNLFIAAPAISQYGAMEAFDYNFLEQYKNEYKKRRDFLYNELKDIFRIDTAPVGAFYIWADISKYSHDCYSFAEELLEKTGVAVTPGTDFGKNNTNNYIRFAYTRNIEHMKEGVKRIKSYLKSRK
ncbi:Aspartate transaminase [Flexistipes sinusarabici DSM 4947]|uniref:Aspartate transaminase n=2 Tax=Flexistipes sinusarabici TaxID=2352 RepID=F8E6J8_FLESM|nr:aminotransferase class I/II-fold pyridoxal phosphate-dependent enzyme [Flexistipes sinusarabici]AEI14835.1 Aspartate transaminase [Flexistipes sinusarabici DSM 4947]HCW92812.1 aminotransferase [Flexistipes sinusarabici]